MSALRIAVVAPYDPAPEPAAVRRAVVGGVEVALAALSRALAARGHDVTLLTTTAGAPGVREVPAPPGALRFARFRRRGALFRAPLSTLALRVPRDADVVHVPATYPFISDAIPRLARRRAQPCLLDYHFDVHATGPLMALAARAYAATLARGMREASLVAVKTRSYAEESRLLRSIPPERIVEIPNGVDVARFATAKRAFEEEYLLCVGRLVPYKGVEPLLRALALVPPGERLPLVVAGDGPLRPSLEALAARLGVEARFLGYVPEEALPTLYAGARATILPSVNGQEAFGIALLESMAAGTPVIASDLPGVRDVARTGGVLARPGDPADLARVLLGVIRGDARLPRGPELRQRIARRYTWERVAAAYERAYDVARGCAG